MAFDSENQAISDSEVIISQCEQATPSDLHTSTNIKSQENSADVLINTEVKTILETACSVSESLAAIFPLAGLKQEHREFKQGQQ